MTNPIKLEIGGVDLSAYLKKLYASPAGPGQVATGTLYLDKAAGGLTILNKQVVKVWQTFNDAGAGVSARGRYFGGFVDIRTEGNIGTTKYWQLPCVSFQAGLRAIVRDAAPSNAFTVTAGTFAAQVLQVTQVVQRGGLGVVALEIDAVSYVANLHATMPAWVAPPGKSLEFYYNELCRLARIEDTALRPAYYLDTQRTFGVGDIFGGPAAHFYDAAVLPTPIYAFSDTPAGAEKPIYRKITRKLESQGMVQRKQAVFGDNFIATYANTTSADTYPNPLINHGRPGNAGYWMTEAVDDTTSTTFAEAEAALAIQVQPVEFPKEQVTMSEVYDIVLPGEVVTVEYALFIPTPTDYRVAEASFDFSDPTQVVQSLTLGTRRRELLDKQAEAAGAQPREGDIIGPDAPVIALDSEEYIEVPGAWEITVDVTPPTAADLAYMVAEVTVGGMTHEEILDGAATTYSFSVPSLTLWALTLYGYDTHGNVGEPSNTLTDTTAAEPTVPAPTDLAVDASGITKAGAAWRRLTYTASTYPIVVRYVFEMWETNDPFYLDTFFSDGARTKVLCPQTAVDVSYSIRVATETLGGRIGPWSSTITHTVQPDPRHDDGGVLDFDATAPGVLFENWPESGVATAGLAVVGDRTRSNTNVLTGNWSMALDLQAANSSIASTSLPVAVRTGDTINIELARIASIAAGTAIAVLQALDKAGAQVGADVTLWTGTPTTAWVVKEDVAQWTAPATVVAWRLVFKYTSGGIWSGGALYWAAPVWKLVASSGDIGAEAINDSHLSILTDPAKYEWDIETNPFKWYDAAGNYRGEFRYISADDSLQFSSANATSNTSLRLMGSGGKSITLLEGGAIEHDPAGAGHLFRDGTVVTNDGVLATNATDGFLYIPTCAGAPTGVPTAYTGTVPLVYDSTNNTLCVRSGGAWKKVGLA